MAVVSERSQSGKVWQQRVTFGTTWKKRVAFGDRDSKAKPSLSLEMVLQMLGSWVRRVIGWPRGELRGSWRVDCSRQLELQQSREDASVRCFCYGAMKEGKEGKEGNSVKSQHLALCHYHLPGFHCLVGPVSLFTCPSVLLPPSACSSSSSSSEGARRIHVPSPFPFRCTTYVMLSTGLHVLIRCTEEDGSSRSLRTWWLDSAHSVDSRWHVLLLIMKASLCSLTWKALYM